MCDLLTCYLTRNALCLLVTLLLLGSSSCQKVPEERQRIVSHNQNHRGLIFSTYLGGATGKEAIRDVVVDSSGHIYITGGTTSSDFPTTPGAYDRTYNGGDRDAFVVKMNPEGKIMWSTLIGGSSFDSAIALEIDHQGYLYLAGRAGEGFPTTTGVFQTEFQGGSAKGPYPAQDGFVAKLSPDGENLVWASYFGAEDDPSHQVRDLAVGKNGDLYIAASSSTGHYPKAILRAFQRGFQPTPKGSRDNVVARIKSDGTEVVWATYLAGSGKEWGAPSIRASDEGSIIVLTATASDDMPTTPGAYDLTHNGETDFHIAKLTPEGKLALGTYLGGSQMEMLETHELIIDTQENIIVASGTTSPDFPTTAGVFQPSYNEAGGSWFGAIKSKYLGDVVVAKLSADGSQLLASTFIGGSDEDLAEGVGIDEKDNIYFTGNTFSENFPISDDALQISHGGGDGDAFIVKLSADLTKIIYSSYMGGEDWDSGRSATVDSNGTLYIGGETSSYNWPTRQALQPNYSGKQRDAILIGIDLNETRSTPQPH